MNKKEFELLARSVKEMKKIRSGKMKAVQKIKIDPLHIKAIRNKMHQSQTSFAYMIGVSPSTLRNWEQGSRKPVGPARALLKVAEKNPEAVWKALHSK